MNRRGRPSKLPESVIEEIESLARQGVPPAEVARRLGLRLHDIYYYHRKAAKLFAEARDRRFHGELREKRKDTRKPIEAKEIEDMAWFHNLIQDVGKHVYHHAVNYVKLEGEDLEDYEKARDKIVGYVDNLIKFSENALRMAEIEAGLALATWMIDKLIERLRKLETIYYTVVQVMCPSCRNKALLHLALQTLEEIEVERPAG